MRRRLQGQEGSVLVIAVSAMAIMLSIGLAALAFGGGQRQLASGERVRESAFNLAEGVLNSQVFLLSKTWAGSSSTAYPGNCSSSVSVANCPDAATITAQFSGAQYSNSSWTAAVQDNGGTVASYYSSTAAASQPAYDANADGKVWVRAQATIAGVSRTVVTQMQAQAVPLPFPKNTLTAGYAGVQSGGKKVLIDTNGRSYTTTAGQAGSVAVRCNTAPQSACLDVDLTKGQLSPPSYQTGYPSGPIITDIQLDQMRTAAQANGTYYASGCPGSLAGTLVFVENGNCSYSNGNANSLAASGVLVIASGTLSMTGNSTFYGLIYARNSQASTGNLVTLQGCSKVIGSVVVEGLGGVLVGSCGNNLAYNSSVTTLAKVAGEPAIVKSTWREVSG